MLVRACWKLLEGPAHHHRCRASTASRKRSQPTGHYCHRSHDPLACARTARAHALTRRPPTAASAPQTSLLTSDKVQQPSSLRSRHTRRRTGRTWPRPRPRCHSSRTRAARTDPSIAIATPEPGIAVQECVVDGRRGVDDLRDGRLRYRSRAVWVRATCHCGGGSAVSAPSHPL